jgi:hypothetical protein
MDMCWPHARKHEPASDTHPGVLSNTVVPRVSHARSLAQVVEVTHVYPTSSAFRHWSVLGELEVGAGPAGDSAPGG